MKTCEKSRGDIWKRASLNHASNLKVEGRSTTSSGSFQISTINSSLRVSCSYMMLMTDGVEYKRFVNVQ